jgi:hypothetical protein
MRSAIVMHRHLTALGHAPAVGNDYVSAVTVPWGMYLNDSIGDCVCADTAHALMLRTANSSGIVIPTDADVLALYETVGGYNPTDPSTDQGCDETAMCQYLESTGFLGHKSNATGMIDPSNIDHIKWAAHLFGSVRLGFNMPVSAMAQFDNGRPWDIDPAADNSLDGGHDVPLVAYDSDFFHVITWGRIQAVTPAFFAKYCDEAHAEVFLDWIRATGVAPSGFNANQLVADLAGLVSGAP